MSGGAETFRNHSGHLQDTVLPKVAVEYTTANFVRYVALVRERVCKSVVRAYVDFVFCSVSFHDFQLRNNVS